MSESSSTNKGKSLFGTNTNPSNIMPTKLTLDSSIKFRCHPEVSCFTACCGNINIILTPYDILRIRKALNLPAEEFMLRLDKSDPRRVPQAPKDEEKSDSTPGVTKYDKMEKKELQEQLKRLQKEVLRAERTARQAREKAAEAEKAHKSASDDAKADALLRMIEANAASYKPTERFRQIRSDFDAAERAYLHLLVTE